MQIPQDLIDIFHAFDGRLVGDEKMKYYVCETVAKLPKDKQEFITRYCWFLSTLEDAWAFTFTGNDLQNQHLIFLSEDLLSQTPQQIFYTIFHEIGHVLLKHRNSVVTMQSPIEISRQEKEADEFAIQFVKKPELI